MESLEIKKLSDIIIVEKSEGNKILKGSKLFCGCCGKPLGELKKNLSFPFESIELGNSLKHKSYDIMILGMRHRTCGHTMFSFKKQFGFITLENYLKQDYHNPKNSASTGVGE